MSAALSMVRLHLLEQYLPPLVIPLVRSRQQIASSASTLDGPQDNAEPYSDPRSLRTSGIKNRSKFEAHLCRSFSKDVQEGIAHPGVIAMEAVHAFEYL
jgi:hypothetical protein